MQLTPYLTVLLILTPSGIRVTARPGGRELAGPLPAIMPSSSRLATAPRMMCVCTQTILSCYFNAGSHLNGCCMPDALLPRLLRTKEAIFLEMDVANLTPINHGRWDAKEKKSTTRTLGTYPKLHSQHAPSSSDRTSRLSFWAYP